MLQPKDIDWLNGYKNKTCIYAVYKRPTLLFFYFCVHVCVLIVYSFLLPSGIPWYGCTIICLEHLTCFQFFAITDKAAMNNCVQVFVWNKFSFLCHKYPGV